MSAEFRFPEYGAGGDTAGARRMRRSFRLCVAACVLLAAMLWVCERYLRYDLPESQYLAALTLAPESSRAILRETVKQNAARHKTPTPKYMAALAEREESDLVLPTYEKAYALDPKNGFLAIRYGCRLFAAGRYGDARERFREAALQLSQNALPHYLEAAAAAYITPGQEDLSGSLALIAKTNSGANPVLFPEPLWSAELPARGAWYSRLRRQAIDECCEPLYQYSDLVLSRAQRQIALREVQYWDSWLETIQVLGGRLASGDDLGTVQATAGIHIELGAIEQREAVASIERRAADPALGARSEQLRAALALLNAFEDSRDARIAADKVRYVQPLALAWKSMAAAFLVYLLAYVASHIMRVGRKAWTVPHSRFARGVLLGGSAVLLLLLFGFGVLQHSTAGEDAGGTGAGFAGVCAIWWSVVAIILAAGLFCPCARIPFPRRVLKAHSFKDTALGAARQAYRTAYFALLRRYYGIACGLLLCVFSLWAVGYRIIWSLYPWQIELLVTGLAREEARVVQQVISLLH